MLFVEFSNGIAPTLVEAEVRRAAIKKRSIWMAEANADEFERQALYP